MGVIYSKTFKSDAGIAVFLPAELGIPADFAVTLEYIDDFVTMRPASVGPKSRQTWLNVLARLDAIGGADEIGERPPVDIRSAPAVKRCPS